MRPVLLSLFGVLCVGGCGSAVGRARRELENPDPQKVIEAVRVLSEAGDTASVARIVGLLGDEEPDVRKAAARGLGRIGDARVVEALAALYEAEEYEDVADAAARALIELGDASVSALERLLGSRAGAVRAGAARALGKLRAAAAVDPLIRLLETDREPDVRIAAVYALRQIGSGRAMDAVARAVQDSDEDVEAAAEKALSGRGYDDQMGRVREVLRLGQ